MKSYILSVKLLNTDIERLISVPEQCDFSDLHIVLQNVLGFEGEHLYHYQAGNIKIIPFEVIVESDDSEELLFDKSVLPAEDATVNLMMLNFDVIKYYYDYGANWEAEIRFVEVAKRASKYPKLISGTGDMANEVCGGPDGLDTCGEPREKLIVREVNWSLHDIFYDYDED